MLQEDNKDMSEKPQDGLKSTYSAPQLIKLKLVEIEGGASSVPEGGDGVFMS